MCGPMTITPISPTPEKLFNFIMNVFFGMSKGLNMLLRLRFRVGGLTDKHGYTRIDFVYSSP